MEINPYIFRAYDIRGVYPTELSEEVAYLIGRAYIKFLKKKRPKIVVGRDNRFSSSSLFKSLTNGIISEGATVINIGLSTTPMLYWACAHFKYDGGINITGSHLPAERNGFKFVRERAIPISEDSGIKEIRDLVLKGKFKKSKRGKIVGKKVLTEYIKFNLKNFQLNKIKPLKIVVDTANAIAGIVVPEIFKKTNCKIYHLYSKLNGAFPNHLPDPLVKENLKTISNMVITKKAALGVAFDGDGDRIIFIDEKGRAISGDLITALVVELILKEKPKEKILFDIRSSNIVRETVKKAGGTPVVWRIGHSFIKEKIRKENIIFAGELSGHYYHKNHYFCECPIFILLKILETISQTKKSISELIKPFEKYFYSGEINFKVKDKEKMLRKLEKNPPADGERGRISKLDGLRIDFKDWWFLVRPSNTEPLLRLVIEAKAKKLMEKKKKELIVLIKD